MKVSELAVKVGELKTEIDEKFAAIDQRFERVDDELDELRQLIKTEGEATRRYFDDEVGRLITAEGDTTRRHFDVVAEKMIGERNLVLDGSMAAAQKLAGVAASNAGDHVRFEHRFDDHDQRIGNLEKARDADPESR